MLEPQSTLPHVLSDRYRIERELSRGGSTTVYLAHDLEHDRRVAIEVLEPELTGGALFCVMPYADEETPREGRWSRARRSIGVASVAAVTVAALVWALTSHARPKGPAEYDVGLPDDAAMTTERGPGFAVASSGDFVVYQAAMAGSAGELWIRSLRDATTRRLEGTARAVHPAISPEGSKVAFLRLGSGHAWTLETMAIEGGTPTVIGRGIGDAELSWLKDGRLQVVGDDGYRVRWFDAGAGPTTSSDITHCAMASPVPDTTRLLCGGGSAMVAHFVGIRAGAPRWESVWTGGEDSTIVAGSHFRLYGEKYLVYLSLEGDLYAAPFDVRKHRVGRAVRMVSGIARRGENGAGSYDLSSSGTLVYAPGANHAVGHLVVMNERSVDTLNVGRDAFRLFTLSPDRSRVAAVVAASGGEELRVYDLRRGQPMIWSRDVSISLPVWNVRGDRLLFGRFGALLAGSPYAYRAAQPVYREEGGSMLEAHAWLADDRIVFHDWGRRRIASLDLTTSPVAPAELAARAAYASMSPDGRWIAFVSSSLDSLWLQPFPATGKRYPIASGDIEGLHWLSTTELTMASRDSGTTMAIDRIAFDFSGPEPTFHRQRWLALPGFVNTPGPSYSLTPDGKVLYLRGAPERPVQYLRVIPDFVSKMRHAVDDANPRPWSLAGWIDRLPK
jgi:Tol biopolymer transport system component